MRRKIFIWFCFACFVTSSINAQSKVKLGEGVRFGLKAGINVANVKFSPSYYFEPKTLTGFTAGGFATIPLTSRFSLQPELTYAQLGDRFSGIGEDTTGELVNFKVKNTLGYLVLPVLVKYQLPKTGLYLYAGPQIGYLLSAKRKTDLDYSTEEISTIETFKRADFSAIVGLEYALPFGINISARYQSGISNFNKVAGTIFKTRNFAYSFTLGYTFGKSK